MVKITNSAMTPALGCYITLPVKRRPGYPVCLSLSVFIWKTVAVMAPVLKYALSETIQGIWYTAN